MEYKFNTLNDLRWLRSYENQACGLYKYFYITALMNDFKSAELFKTLSNQERKHREIVSKVIEIEEKRTYSKFNFPVSLSKGVKGYLNQMMRKSKELVYKKEITEKELLDVVVEIEKSELDEYFHFISESKAVDNYLKTEIFKEMRIHHRTITDYFKQNNHIDQLNNFNSKITGEKKILVADDEELIRTTIGKYLGRKLMVGIDYAKDGQDALEKIIYQQEIKKPYIAIVSDINMPYMNGDQLHLQANHIQGFITPFFIISGEQTNEQRNYFSKLKIPIHPKPLNLEYLEESIIGVVSGTYYNI